MTAKSNKNGWRFRLTTTIVVVSYWILFITVQNGQNVGMFANGFSQQFQRSPFRNGNGLFATYINDQREDADFIGMAIGGQRYEMIPLPDNMLDTTLYVGNLDEFVHDDDLSDLFQSVSVLHSLPACVIRKMDMSSLRYGFVSFPTIEEKENAIIRFHGREWKGRRIKVEAIRDHPKIGRVRVPERMVSYVSGASDYTVRRNNNNGVSNKKRNRKKQHMNKYKNQNDIYLENKRNKANNKRQKNIHSHSGSSTHRGDSNSQQNRRRGGDGGGRRDRGRHRRRLTGPELDAFDRSIKRGYVTLSGTGYYCRNKNNNNSNNNKFVAAGAALAQVHREWCDAHEKPQVILCKATAGRQLDNVVVDLSPLRLLCNHNDEEDDSILLRWKIDIFNAAVRAGMELRDDCDIDDYDAVADAVVDGDDDTDDNDESDFIMQKMVEDEQNHINNILTKENNQYKLFNIGTSTDNNIIFLDGVSHKKIDKFQPIRELPALNIGVFEGERSKAKAMIKELVSLWRIPEDENRDPNGNSSSRKTKNKNFIMKT